MKWILKVSFSSVEWYLCHDMGEKSTLLGSDIDIKRDEIGAKKGRC